LFEIYFLFEYSLARKPTAIVSSIAGTTRDVIESTIDLGGYPVVICDTAGLRITNDPIENEGVLRAFNRLVNLFSLK
jgi:tRNA modification GTPase